MDLTEDLSARILLKHILTTETPKTPITRSASKAAAAARSRGTRSSSRLSNKNAGDQTPKDILRRSLKNKMRETITRKSMPPPKRRTSSIVQSRLNMPASGSMLFDEGETPRHILRNIMRLDPVRSPVVHEKAAPEEPLLISANASIASMRPSIELSSLDLPDLTIGNAKSTVKGLSRKRKRRSLNVTAFEKRLEYGEDVEEPNEESVNDQSSHSLSSVSSLSLKATFMDVGTEKKGLKRRVSNRRKITEEAFGSAVDKRLVAGVSSFVSEHGPSDSAFMEGFTLGLTKLSETNITTDFVHCNTALYPQPDATTSDFSIVTTQDKPTVMASQLQRQISGINEVEQNELENEEMVYNFPTEEKSGAENPDEECISESQGADSRRKSSLAKSRLEKEEEKRNAESQISVRADTVTSEDEECDVEAQKDEEAAESQTEENDGGDLNSETVEETKSQSEEEEVPDSQTIEAEQESQTQEEEESEEEEQPAESQTQEEEESEEEEQPAESQTQEEEESEEEEQPAESQTQEEEESEEEEQPAESQTQEEEESEEEEQPAESQTQEEEESEEEEQPAESQTQEEEESEEEEQPAESETQEEEDLEEEEQPAESQTQEEEEEEEEKEEDVDSVPEEDDDDDEVEVADDQTSPEDPAEVSLTHFTPGDERDGEPPQGETEEQLSGSLRGDLEHKGLRRAHQSEGGLLLAKDAEGNSSTAGKSDRKSKVHTTMDLYSLDSVSCGSGQVYPNSSDRADSSAQGRTDAVQEVDPDDDKENSFQIPEMNNEEKDGHLNDEPTVDAAAQEEDWEDQDDDEDDDEASEDLPGKTPAFVREKIKLFRSDPLDSPTVLKNIQARSSGDEEALPTVKPKQVKKRVRKPSRTIPKTYLMGMFKHFAKTKVSSDVYPVLEDIMDKFFVRLAEDLETYAVHAKRKNIDVEDAKLLLRRQGHVSDKVPVEVLIEKYLRMDQRRLLIPIATSGNAVFPQMQS